MSRTWKTFALCLALVAIAAFSVVHPAAAQTTDRPLSDFLSTQGTTSIYLPPIPDFIGWTNNDPQTKFAGVDYAGLAATYLGNHGGPILGTSITGGITETRLPDGTYEVVVTANAKDALAWVCPFPADIVTTPTVFGTRGSELAANPNLPFALVNSSLKFTIITTVAGAPIPDLTGPVPYTLKNLKISATGQGNVPGGGTGKLSIIQSGVFNTQWKGALGDGFPAEKISIK